jgi:FSR family fosmidomycin resistance protein-like MFS transporter
MGNLLMPLFLISLGHFFIDFYVNLLPGLMPTIINNLGLSMTLSGLLFTMFSMTSSWLQPVFGYIAGRFDGRRVMVLAVLLAAVFMPMVGIANNYVFMLIVVLISGIGSSLYHPLGSVFIAALYEKNHDFIMALYITAGTVGMTLAPVMSTAVKNRFGLKGVFYLAIPGIMAGILLLIFKNRLSFIGGYEVVATGGSDLYSVRVKFLANLVMVVGLRTWVLNAFTLYIPTYYFSKGLPEGIGAGILSLYLLFQSLGGVVGGYVSDRIGIKRTLILSSILAIIFLTTFFNTSGAVSIISLILSGALLQSAFPGAVVLAQRLYPANPGLATGFMQGFTFGIGALGGVFTGALSDVLGGNLVYALMSSVILLCVSLACSFLIPAIEKREVNPTCD